MVCAYQSTSVLGVVCSAWTEKKCVISAGRALLLSLAVTVFSSGFVHQLSCAYKVAQNTLCDCLAL